MTASVYDYEKGLSDLTNNYAKDEATNAYARFISKQRFGQQRQDTTTGFQRAFPQFTGGFAHKLGSGIRSGVFGDKLNQFVGDYGQSQDRLNQSEAGFDSNSQQTQAMNQSQYQQQLLALQEELARQRAMTNPYASYQGVYQ